MSITLTEKVMVTQERTIEHHELIRELRDAILSYGPEHFDMTMWFNSSQGIGSGLDDILRHGIDTLNTCGTTGCLAGHMASYTVKHGITALVVADDMERDHIHGVRAESLAALFGVPTNAFSSDWSEWHDIAKQAFINDMDIQLHATPLEYLGYPRDDEYADKQLIRVTDYSAYDHMWGSEPYRVMVDGEEYTDDEATRVIKSYRRHAEWVAITTYLLYIAQISQQMHYMGEDGADGYFRRSDMYPIVNSPAWSYKYAEDEVTGTVTGLEPL